MDRLTINQKADKKTSLHKNVQIFSMKVAVTVLLALFATATLSAPVAAKDWRTAKVSLRDTDGVSVGKMFLMQKQDSVQVLVKVQNLAPGFHGFHVHGVGKCTPDFTAAGGHFNPTGGNHGEHAGDMPVLLVIEDGTGEMSFKTDRFLLEDLFDEDGSAIIIHAGSDNYANIPERYMSTEADHTGPDAATLAAGDAGARVACGVVKWPRWSR